MELLLADEERALRSRVRDYADRVLAPRAAGLDEREEYPWDNLKEMATMGLLGLTIDPAYGGAGGSALGLAITVEEVSRGCASTGVTYLSHLSLAADCIIRFGSQAQRQQYLPQLANGACLAAFALTEPQSGSDAARVETTAAQVSDGYLLNGTKTYVTNGPQAGILIVFAATGHHGGRRDISAFIVPSNSAGLHVTPQLGKMGIRGSVTGRVDMTDCFLPTENRIGDEGQGFRIAMTILDSSRTNVAAQAVGIAQGALDASIRHSQQRVTFGSPLSEHQAIQFMLADMATQLDAARLLVRRAAYLKDAGLPHSKESAMAKLFASETGSFVCDKALQIHGGIGYFNQSPVQRHYRDVRVTEIYEGTSEIQRMVIARHILRESATTSSGSPASADAQAQHGRP